MLPNGVGRGCMIGRQIFRAFTRGDHVETRTPRPFHLLANQRGLIAIGKRINDARGTRFLRQQRASQRVGLHVHHHHVLAVFATLQHVMDAERRIAGGVDHDFDFVRRDEVVGGVEQIGRGFSFRFGERFRRKSIFIPAGIQ